MRRTTSKLVGRGGAAKVSGPTRSWLQPQSQAACFRASSGRLFTTAAASEVAGEQHKYEFINVRCLPMHWMAHIFGRFHERRHAQVSFGGGGGYLLGIGGGQRRSAVGVTESARHAQRLQRVGHW
jgi:hypothetical protein